MAEYRIVTNDHLYRVQIGRKIFFMTFWSFDNWSFEKYSKAKDRLDALKEHDEQIERQKQIKKRPWRVVE